MVYVCKMTQEPREWAVRTENPIPSLQLVQKIISLPDHLFETRKTLH